MRLAKANIALALKSNAVKNANFSPKLCSDQHLGFNFLLPLHSDVTCSAVKGADGWSYVARPNVLLPFIEFSSPLKKSRAVLLHIGGLKIAELLPDSRSVPLELR